MRPDVQCALTLCDIRMGFGAGDLDRAMDLLQSVVGLTEATPRCGSCVLARDAMEEGRVGSLETWNSEPAFRRHVRSEGFLRALVSREVSREEPRVMVGMLSGIRGMAHLQELRSVPDPIVE